MSAVIEKKGFSHSLTRLIGALAALVLLGVSAAMNYLFLSSLGKTPVEAHVLGAASAAADLLKAVLPFLIFWAWCAGRLAVAGPGRLVWALFTVFSLLSATGFAAGNRETIRDTRSGTGELYKTLRSELTAAQAAREALPQHRPAAIVAAAIQAHKQHRRWASTKGCTDATVPQSRAYCRGYFALQAELAAAQRSAALAEKIAGLRKQLQALRAAGGAREPEPQVGLLARLFGLERDPVRLALILLIAGLVELGSGLGLYLSVSGWGRVRGNPQRPARETPLLTDRNSGLSQSSEPIGAVADFAWACLQPAPGHRLTENDLLKAYQKWCEAEGRGPLSQEAFAKAFWLLAADIGVERKGREFNALGFVSHNDEEFAERFPEG